MPPSSRAPLARLVEYFTLRRAREAQARIAPPVRESIADALDVARQRGDAADTLWTAGFAVEALRLAIEALDESLATVAPLVRALGIAGEGIPEGEPAPIESGPIESGSPEDAGLGSAASDVPRSDPDSALRRALLAHRGASASEIDTVERAVTARRGAEVPRRVSAIGPAHATLFDLLGRARRVLDRRLGGPALAGAALGRLRAKRVAVTAMIAVGLAAAVVLVMRRPDHAVSASAVWGNAPMYAAERATDGRLDTWWLLPNEQTGWLEVRFRSPRRIDQVRMVNTSNPPHNDRGVERYRIELRGEGRVLRTLEGTLPYPTTPRWVDVAAGVDGVDTIRFVVVSHHELSGGLSELAWD